MKVTRRSLVAMVAAPALGQTTAPSPADDLKTARDLVKSNADQLAKVPLPMSTEPATVFRA
jgi:hypothetical protein